MGYLGDMMLKRDGAVVRDSKVKDERRGSQRGLINREHEVVGRFGEGFWTDDEHSCRSLISASCVHDLTSLRQEVRVAWVEGMMELVEM